MLLVSSGPGTRPLEAPSAAPILAPRGCRLIAPARPGRPRVFPTPGSHLQGMFFRTARMLEAGMKPV